MQWPSSWFTSLIWENENSFNKLISQAPCAWQGPRHFVTTQFSGQSCSSKAEFPTQRKNWPNNNNNNNKPTIKHLLKTCMCFLFLSSWGKVMAFGCSIFTISEKFISLAKKRSPWPPEGWVELCRVYTRPVGDLVKHSIFKWASIYQSGLVWDKPKHQICVLLFPCPS